MKALVESVYKSGTGFEYYLKHTFDPKCTEGDEGYLYYG